MAERIASHETPVVRLDTARFTAGNVAKLTLPDGKADHIEWDPELPGFGVRLRSGSAFYIVQYRVGTKQRRESLGDIRKTELEQARKNARVRFAQVELGIDPGPSGTSWRPPRRPMGSPSGY